MDKFKSRFKRRSATDKFKLINAATIILLVLAFGLILILFLPITLLPASNIDIIISGIVAIAVALQIISSNTQASRYIPTVKVVESYVSYKVRDLGNGDSRITRFELKLNLLNESSIPVVLELLKLNIGNYDTKSYWKFNVVTDEDKVEIKNVLTINPHSMKEIHLTENFNKYPYSSGFHVRMIEELNQKKLEDIHEGVLTLIGNMGTKDFKVSLHRMRS